MERFCQKVHLGVLLDLAHEEIVLGLAVPGPLYVERVKHQVDGGTRGGLKNKM